MGDIVLSAGVRQNLLSLQNTAHLMSITQNRLATGKKVNSALDNPFNFFTSQSLSNRASDLNALLDSIGQAQQTIAAADHGISALTKLVESAKSIAKQAQQTTQPTAAFSLALTGNTAIAADAAAVGTGSVTIASDTEATLTGTVGSVTGGTFLSALGVADGDDISVSDGTNTTTYTVGTAATTTVSTLLTALGAGGPGNADVAATVNGGFIEIKSNNTTDSISISSTGSLAGLGFGTGNTSADAANATIGALTGTLTVTQGAGTPVTIDFSTVKNRTQLLNELGSIATIDGSNHLVLTASNATDSLALSASGNALAGLGLSASYDPTNATIDALTGTLTVKVGSAATQTITFGSGNVTNRAQLAAALGALTGVTATINGADQIALSSSTADEVVIGGADASSFFAAGNIGANEPTVAVVTPNATRANLQGQYNDLLIQIDALARDASYNGVNLLFGDNLTVTFNEDGTSLLNIAGVNFDSLGLGLAGLAGVEFQTNTGLDDVLVSIDSALSALRAQASNFGSKLGTVQTRQDFTKKLIQTLQTGADNLVLADTNEEGANMLALQTRQSLSTTALSLSAQADQAVLRLFG